MVIKRGKVSFCVNRKKDCFEHLRQYIGKKLSIRQKQTRFLHQIPTVRHTSREQE